MDLFSSTEVNNESQEGKAESSVAGLIVLLLTLSIGLLPAVIAGLLYYAITFTWFKLRPSVNLIVLAIIIGIWSLCLSIVKPFSFLSQIFNFDYLADNLISMLWAYVFICIPLGLVVSFIVILFNCMQLKKHPELRSMKGWAYNFEFRKTPWAVLQRKLFKKRLKAATELSYDKAPLGILDGPILTVPENAEPVKTEAIVSRYYKEAFAHTLITGQTGSGKTYTELTLVYNDIVAGNPVCFIDFKKSPDVIYYLSKWAKENNRPFYHFTSGKVGQYRNPYQPEQATYDPLSSGSPTSKADMMLNLRNWDGNSEVFKKRTQDILQSLFYLIDRTDPKTVPTLDWNAGGLAQFVSSLDVANLFSMIEAMSREMSDGSASAGDERRMRALKELYLTLSNKSGGALRDQISEMASNCRTLIMSSYGDWLAEGASSKHINLLDIATSQDGPIALFSFNPQEEADFARYMGSIVLSDLSRVSAIKNARGDDTPFGVYCDEFQTLNPDSVKDMLEKSRSAKFYITLSLQSLEQVIKASASNGEASLAAIIDTCSNFIFHAGAAEDSAEKMAKIIGRHYRTEYQVMSKMNSHLLQLNWLNTRLATVSKKRVEDWIVSPYEFQHLSAPTKENGFKATAYIINKFCTDPKFVRESGVLARRVQIIVPDCISEGLPADFKSQIYVPSGNTQKSAPTIAPVIPDTASTEEDWDIEEIDTSAPCPQFTIDNKAAQELPLEFQKPKTTFELLKGKNGPLPPLS